MLTSQSKAIFIIYLLINVDDPTVNIIIFIILYVKAVTNLRLTLCTIFKLLSNCKLEQLYSFVTSI